MHVGRRENVSIISISGLTLIRMATMTLLVYGSSNFSTPAKWSVTPRGHNETMLNNPTNPKKSCISTRDSVRMRTLSRVTYTAYIIADNSARLSPSIGNEKNGTARIGCVADGKGDGGRSEGCDESDNDTSMTPVKLYEL